MSLQKTTADIYNTFTSVTLRVTSPYWREKMNTSASRNNDHLLHWIATTLILIGFALGDTAIIVWCASLVTLWPMVVSIFSYVLIAMGVVFTVWQMSEISNKRT